MVSQLHFATCFCTSLESRCGSKRSRCQTVTEQQFPTVGIFVFQIIVIKLVHYQFENFDNAKTYGNWFIRMLACSANKREIVVDDLSTAKSRPADTAFASLFGSQMRRTLTRCLTCCIVLPKVAFSCNFAKSDSNSSRAIFRRSEQ